MNCSTPGFPVHHQLLELAQTHIHQVSDAIQPSHPLSSPSPSAFNLSQQTGCFSNESVFCIRWPKYWSFSISLINIQDWFPLGLTDLISLQSKGLKNLLQHHSSKPSIGSFLKMQNLRLNAHKMNLRLNAHKMMFTYIVIKIIIVTMMMSIYYQQSFQKPLSDV